MAGLVDFPNGIPSHDTIGRILSLIKPDQFQRALLDWINCQRNEHVDGEEPLFVQIDGQTLRITGKCKQSVNEHICMVCKQDTERADPQCPFGGIHITYG